MAINLNFLALSITFLCLDQPIVINTIAIMFINGCSTANKRAAELNPPIPLVVIASSPLGETKNRIRPISNCKCDNISANNDTLKSLLKLKSLLDVNPEIAFITAKIKIAKTIKAK